MPFIADICITCICGALALGLQPACIDILQRQVAELACGLQVVAAQQLVPPSPGWRCGLHVQSLHVQRWVAVFRPWPPCWWWLHRGQGLPCCSRTNEVLCKSEDACTVLQVVAAGWTVSPLLPKYTHDGPSAESLVTLVFKVDLQGWLSLRSGGAWGRVLASLQGTSLGLAVRNRYLGPLLMSLVTLRDQVGWHVRLNWSARAT